MKIKKKLKHILDGISCLLEEEQKREVVSKKETKRMYSIFNTRKMYFLERNSERIIKENFIPQIQKQFFKETGLLMSEEQALKEAVAKFLLYRDMGWIDTLNNLVEVK